MRKMVGPEPSMVVISKSEIQSLVLEEVRRAVEVTETKMESLLEKVKKLDEPKIEFKIRKLEAHIKKVKRRGDASMAYVRKLGLAATQNQRVALSSAVMSGTVDLSRSDSVEDLVESTTPSLKTKKRKSMSTEMEVETPTAESGRKRPSVQRSPPPTPKRPFIVIKKEEQKSPVTVKAENTQRETQAEPPMSPERHISTPSPAQSGHSSGTSTPPAPTGTTGGKATVERSKATVEDSKATVERSKATVEDSKATVDGSKATVEESKATVKGSKATVDGSKATVDGSKATFDGSKATVKGSKATVDRSKATVDGSKATVDGSKATVDGSKATVDGSKATVDGSKATVDGSKATVDGSKATVDGSKATVKGSKATVDGSKATVKGSKATVKGSKATVDGSKATVKGSKATVDGSKATVDGSKATVDGSKATVDGSKATVDGSKATVDGSKATVDGSKATVDGSKATVDGSKATVDGSKATVKDGQRVAIPPLPTTAFPAVLPATAASFSIPPKVELSLAYILNPPSVSVMWDAVETDSAAAPMDSYSVYMALEKMKGSGVYPGWKMLGEVRAIPLPMVIIIKKEEIMSRRRLCFAVVGKDKFGRYGPYSDIKHAILPD